MQVYPSILPRLFKLSDYVRDSTIDTLPVNDLLTFACNLRFFASPQDLPDNFTPVLTAKLEAAIEHAHNDLLNYRDLVFVLMHGEMLHVTERLVEAVEELIRQNFAVVVRDNSSMVEQILLTDSRKEYFVVLTDRFLEQLTDYLLSSAVTQNRQYAVFMSLWLAHCLPEQLNTMMPNISQRIQNLDLASLEILIKGVTLLHKNPEKAKISMPLVDLCVKRRNDVMTELRNDGYDAVISNLHAHLSTRVMLHTCINMSHDFTPLADNKLLDEDIPDGMMTYSMETALARDSEVTSQRSDKLASALVTSLLARAAHEDSVVHLEHLRMVFKTLLIEGQVTEVQRYDLHCHLEQLFHQNLKLGKYDVCVLVLSLLVEIDVMPRKEIKRLMSKEVTADIIAFLKRNPAQTKTMQRSLAYLDSVQKEYFRKRFYVIFGCSVFTIVGGLTLLAVFLPPVPEDAEILLKRGGSRVS